MEIRAEFDDPINAKHAKLALEQIGAPSLGISSQARTSGTSAAVTTTGGGFWGAVAGLFSGGKASTGMNASGFRGKSIGWSTEKTFGGGPSLPDEHVIHESFDGDHHETMKVTIDDAYAEQARAAITSNGGRLV